LADKSNFQPTVLSTALMLVFRPSVCRSYVVCDVCIVG